MTDLNQKLSEHFTLGELLKSNTADANGFTEQYEPSDEVIGNLKNLCIYVLEFLRAKVSEARGVDTPVYLTSGYRCARVNAAVGGVPNSQHQTGEAADTHVEGMTTEEWYQFVKNSGITFDQLIQEFDSWAHISHSINNRGECWRYVRGSAPKRD